MYLGIDIGTSSVKTVLFDRDQRLVVVDKPTGLLVHRSPIDRHETRFALQILRDQLTMRLVVLNACEGARASPDDPF